MVQMIIVFEKQTGWVFGSGKQANIHLLSILHLQVQIIKAKSNIQQVKLLTNLITEQWYFKSEKDCRDNIKSCFFF